jgi:steroid delta-isomerase-like uncharacterized protein
MSDEHKTIVRRVFEELFNGKNLDAADELYAADYVDNDPAAPDTGTGPERVKQEVQMYLGGFPDLTFTVEDQIAEGDMVVTRWTSSGTFKGEFLGIPPNGKWATGTGITIHRLAGGVIQESWTNMDSLGLLQQIGVISAIGQG